MKLLSSILTLAIALLIGAAGPASAKTCRDSHGKFMKCPAPVMTAAKTRCRDAKGHFMKCPAKMKAMKM